MPAISLHPLTILGSLAAVLTDRDPEQQSEGASRFVKARTDKSESTIQLLHL